MNPKFRYYLLVAGSLVVISSAAQSREAGDFLVRAGIAAVDPNESSANVRVGATKLDGWKVGVDSDRQLGLTATYMLTDYIGLGVLAATPFKHDINGADALAGVGKLAEIKHLPPTLTLQFFPLSPASRVQPYVGVGVNYTFFFEEKTTPTLTGALGADSSDIELDDSVGVAVEFGIDYALSDNVGLNVSLWWIDIDTEATITGYNSDGSTTVGTVDVEIDPAVYMVGLSYKF